MLYRNLFHIVVLYTVAIASPATAQVPSVDLVFKAVKAQNGQIFDLLHESGVPARGYLFSDRFGNEIDIPNDEKGVWWIELRSMLPSTCQAGLTTGKTLTTIVAPASQSSSANVISSGQPVSSAAHHYFSNDKIHTTLKTYGTCLIRMRFLPELWVTALSDYDRVALNTFLEPLPSPDAKWVESIYERYARSLSLTKSVIAIRHAAELERTFFHQSFAIPEEHSLITERRYTIAPEEELKVSPQRAVDAKLSSNTAPFVLIERNTSKTFLNRSSLSEIYKFLVRGGPTEQVFSIALKNDVDQTVNTITLNIGTSVDNRFSNHLLRIPKSVKRIVVTSDNESAEFAFSVVQPNHQSANNYPNFIMSSSPSTLTACVRQVLHCNFTNPFIAYSERISTDWLSIAEANAVWLRKNWRMSQPIANILQHIRILQEKQQHPLAEVWLSAALIDAKKNQKAIVADELFNHYGRSESNFGKLGVIDYLQKNLSQDLADKFGLESKFIKTISDFFNRDPKTDSGLSGTALWTLHSERSLTITDHTSIRHYQQINAGDKFKIEKNEVFPGKIELVTIAPNSSRKLNAHGWIKAFCDDKVVGEIPVSLALTRPGDSLQVQMGHVGGRYNLLLGQLPSDCERLVLANTTEYSVAVAFDQIDANADQGQRNTTGNAAPFFIFDHKVSATDQQHLFLLLRSVETNGGVDANVLAKVEQKLREDDIQSLPSIRQRWQDTVSWSEADFLLSGASAVRLDEKTTELSGFTSYADYKTDGRCEPVLFSGGAIDFRIRSLNGEKIKLTLAPRSIPSSSERTISEVKVFLNGKTTRVLSLQRETKEEQILTVPSGENTVRLEVMDNWQAAPIGIKLAVKDGNGWRSQCQPHHSTWLTTAGDDVKLAGPTKLVRITEIRNGLVKERVSKTSARLDGRIVVDKDIPFRIDYLKYNPERRRRLSALSVQPRSVEHSSDDTQVAEVYARPPQETGQTLRAVGYFQSGSEYNNEELRERRSLSAIYHRQTPYWQFGLQPKSTATSNGTRLANISSEASIKPLGPNIEFNAGFQGQRIIDSEISRTTASLGLGSRLDHPNQKISVFANFNRRQVFGNDPSYVSALSWSREHPEFFKIGAIAEYLPAYQQSLGLMAELTTNTPGADAEPVDSYRATGTYKYKFTPFFAAHSVVRLQEYRPDQHRLRSERQSTWLPGVTYLSSRLRSVFHGALAIEGGGNIGVQLSMTTILKGDSLPEAVAPDDYYYLMSSN